MSPPNTATTLAKTIHQAAYRQLVDFLRERRELLGVSQGALARELGWSQQKVSYIETGARRMDVLEFISLARALGVGPVAAFRRAAKTTSAKARR